jgi:3-phenylpropionate/cinnamic acid dioxygenase small subunit
MSTTARTTPTVTPADWIELHNLVMTYAEAIDTKDWELFRTAFTEDCAMTYGEPWGMIEGLDALADFAEFFHSPLDNSRHGTTNFRISSIDGDTATGRCSVDALLVQAGAEGGDTLRVVGAYIDNFVKTSDGWKFSHREFTPIFSEGNDGGGVGAWEWNPPS